MMQRNKNVCCSPYLVTMKGIYRIGTQRFSQTPNRLFAHQLGDGFVIVSEFEAQSLETPLAIAILLMRFVLISGGVTKSAISEGSFANIKGCYPDCIRDNVNKQGVIRLGSGLMRIFPVMGTALINSYRVHHKSPSGSLLVIDGSLFDHIPSDMKVNCIDGLEMAVIDWLHTDMPATEDISGATGWNLSDVPTMERQLDQYIQNNNVSQDWERNTREYLGLR